MISCAAVYKFKLRKLVAVGEEIPLHIIGKLAVKLHMATVFLKIRRDRKYAVLPDGIERRFFRKLQRIPRQRIVESLSMGARGSFD